MAVISVGIVVTTVVSAVFHVGQNSLARGSIEPVYWEAAMALKESGIRPGDKVAIIAKQPAGDDFPFVARLARAQIIAQVNRRDRFFAAAPSAQLQVIQAIARSRAKAILMTGEPPPTAPETKWEPLGLTNYYFCLLGNAGR
jgi:hypothetical protein